MCDANLIGGLILGADIALIAASVLLILAIADGKDIFGALASQGYCISTAILVGAAIALLAVAANALSPGCTTGPCGPSASEVAKALGVVISMLSGVLAMLALSIFLPVTIVVTGPATLVLLVGAGGSLGYLGGALVVLATCLAGVGTPSLLLDIASVATVVTGVVVLIAAIYGIIVTIQVAIAAASG